MEFEQPERIGVTVIFEPNLPLPDMKARLVLNRLASRGRVLETHPSAEQLDEVDALAEFTVWLASDCDPEELRSLADVDGVARIRIDPSGGEQSKTRRDEPARSTVSRSEPTATEVSTAAVASPPPDADPAPSELPVRFTPPGPVAAPTSERVHPAPRRQPAPKPAASRARRRLPRRSGSRATASIT